jgi:phage portal protein BeeE
MKARFNASVKAGEPFVTGQDWEYTPLTAANHATDWIEGKQYGVADIARFFDCPGDLIDAAVSTGNITYASITQRNLQFLIMHLGPAVIRRENALSRLTSKPRFVKLNTDALLRMDPATRALTLKTQIDARTLAPSEARALDDRPPLTDSQMAEFDRLFGTPNKTPTGTQPTGATS